MKYLKIIFLIIFILIIAGICYAAYLGVFSNVMVTEKEAGGYKLVGKEYKGPYNDAGLYISEVENKLKEFGISGNLGFGIYYDDPKVTAAQQCRSYVGVILEENDFDKFWKLEKTGFKIDSVSAVPSLIAEFPLKSKWSYLIGPMKVYPAISKILTENRYKSNLALEIYDVPQKKIVFIMQFSKTD